MVTSKTLDIPGYEVVQLLGNGARSTIWKIRARREDEYYALKRVVKRDSSDARFFQQAINEHQIGSQLDHPVIRHIYKIRKIRKFFRVSEIQLIMEYCRGQSLQADRPESVVKTMRIFSRVAAALSYMNSRGFVHADMKPNNVIVADDETVKIVDLGQACPIGTVKQRIQGTPDFIAPEQVNRNPLDARTDVFNFGASLYWTLTGQAIPTAMPKRGEVTLKNEMKVVPPRKLNPRITPAIEKLIIDCIEFSPTRRPESMKEVASRVDLIVRSLENNKRPTATEPESPPHV